MPSFATEVKNELARLFYKRGCCRRAELAGLLRMGAALTLGAGRTLGLSFTTENAAVARKVLVLIKEFDKVRTEVTVTRARRLKKKNTYRIKVVPSPQVSDLLNELGMMPGTGPVPGRLGPLLRRSCCRWAYLRGAFLGGGTVNRPEADYHLELVMGNYQFADLVAALFKKIEIEARLTDRKDTYIVYMKDCDSIMDFLQGLEADKAVEAFGIARNLKEVRNQVNRLVNCETANMQKTVEAAAHQVVGIQRIIRAGRLESLPDKLQKTARARLDSPEASLGDLAAELGVSRSSVSHRLHRILALAQEISQDEADDW